MNRRRKLLNVFALLAISLGFATGVVAADYIGPDRVHTETSYDTCEYGGWAQNGGGCWANGVPVDCTICEWECDPGSCPGADYYFVSGIRVIEHTVTVTDSEATVSSSVDCSVWGDAGWCTQPANTVITGHEPMPANQIILEQAAPCPCWRAAMISLIGPSLITAIPPAWGTAPSYRIHKPRRSTPA